MNKYFALLKEIKDHYAVLGMTGPWLLTRSRLSERTECIAVSRDGYEHAIYLRPGTSDVTTFKQVLLDREYDFAARKAPETIIDAGANVGFTSVYFARKYPDAKIYSFEPERSNFELLKKNTLPYKNVTPVRAAIWKKNGHITLTNPGYGHWGFQTNASKRDNIGEIVEEVRSFSIDQILKDYDIDYLDVLKIDVEGAEKEIFEDRPDWIDSVGIILIELHDRIKKGCSESFYNATNNFGMKVFKGDNVFLFRDEYAPGKEP